MKIVNKIIGTRRVPAKQEWSPNIKPKGALFEWCRVECEKIGLELVADTLIKEYDVYRGNSIVGRYNKLSEVKSAIKSGEISEPYNL